MNRTLGIVCLAVGIVLVVLGVNAADSLSSDFSEFFKGRPNNESVWFLLGGLVLGVFGVLSLSRRRSLAP